GSVALTAQVLLPGSPQHHEKQAVPIDLHAFQYCFSGIWNQRSLFHRTQPEIARAALLLPPNTLSAKCPLWFTKATARPSLALELTPPASHCMVKVVRLNLFHRPTSTELSGDGYDFCQPVHLQVPFCAPFSCRNMG